MSFLINCSNDSSCLCIEPCSCLRFISSVSFFCSSTCSLRSLITLSLSKLFLCIAYWIWIFCSSISFVLSSLNFTLCSDIWFLSKDTKSVFSFLNFNSSSFANWDLRFFSVWILIFSISFSFSISAFSSNLLLWCFIFSISDFN